MTFPVGFHRSVWFMLFLTAWIVVAGVAQAQTFDGCVDAQGRPVPSIADDLIPGVVQATEEDGQVVLRYSTAALPRLSPTVRMFFFAHECGRLALGYPVAAARTAAAAQRADCWALVALQASNLLAGEAALRNLQSDLQFTEAEWRLLPGPRREFHLDSCTIRGALRMPVTDPPSEQELNADRCIHACGDRLWQCQNRCRDAACRGRCEAAFGGCESDCAKR